MSTLAILTANAMVSSLDYCNSLFTSLSSFNMCKLQCIQSTLSRIVRKCNKYSLVSHVLKQLHWLPVEFRCISKQPLWFISFSTVVIQPISVLFLSIHCGRYDTTYNCPDNRFLGVPQYYPSVYK